MASTKELLKNLKIAEGAVDRARADIIHEIRDRMGPVTPYRFALATGINKGNLYNLLVHHKWNGAVAFAALDLLPTPITVAEVEEVI